MRRTTIIRGVVATAVASALASAGGTSLAASAASTGADNPAPSSFSVTRADLTMDRCEERGTFWFCPFTVSFSFNPGAGGTVAWTVAGTEATCAGSSSTFDQHEPDFTVPSNAIGATVASYLVFPGSARPATAAPALGSVATVHVHRPNELASAAEPFSGPVCP
jgi:hypothetical protein